MELIPNPLIIPAGLIIGVLIAAPVGPVNVLCVQRAIERGFWGGVAAGMGAVLGDGLIALFAALGVNAITGAIKHHRTAIQLVGGLALGLFGMRLLHAHTNLAMVSPHVDEKAALKDYAWDIPKTFFLTITNPGAVLGLFAIFGGVSAYVEIDSFIDAFTMVAAIIGGSIAWWIGLSSFIARIRHRIDGDRFRLINRIAGLLLVGFAGLMLGEVAWKWMHGTLA